MRVFLDTNVLVSAFTTRGLSEDLFREVLASHDLIVSTVVLNELDRVLREKFKMPRALVWEILAFLRHDAVLSKVGALPEVKIHDRDDLPILSSALEGKADVFVTGDKELLDLQKVSRIEILSPRGFWEKLKTA
jgi:putative PIN family toxin of toxin-antitoxin system